MNAVSTTQASNDNEGAGGERSEMDNVTSVELQSNRRLLYFSDGVMEELSSDSDTDADATDTGIKLQLNPQEMALGPRIRYRAAKIGSTILAGIDYIGGGLASFFGISTPKYASEIGYYLRAKKNAELNAEDDIEQWQINANNNNENNRNATPIILCEPRVNAEPFNSPRSQ